MTSTCSYCFKSNNLTREHLIPRWYINTPGDAETFNARSPISQIKGDLIIKDVCAECNNIYLGGLDNYGKKLYELYFKESTYYGESITFEYEYSLLTRWLLKLCYNSARANNADTQVLNQFTKQILGKEELTNHVQIFLNLITPTLLAPNSTACPATRKDIEHHEVHEPRWFRIAQFRLPIEPTDILVQRQVIINSFAFTMCAVSPKVSLPNDDLEEFSQEFAYTFPDAKALTSNNKIVLNAGKHHAFQSISWLWYNYPSRFLDNKNPLVTRIHKGEDPLILIRIPLELIEQENIDPVAAILTDMVSTRENATAYKQRVGLTVDGFDDDPRSIWQIPKAKNYLRLLFLACPFIMLLSNSNESLLKLLALCWVYEEDQNESSENQRMEQFLTIAFNALNQVMHKLALSIELNKKITNDVNETLFGES